MGAPQLDLSRAVSLAEQALSDGDFAAAEKLAKEALDQGTSYEALV
jgi:phage shock protein A